MMNLLKVKVIVLGAGDEKETGRQGTGSEICNDSLGRIRMLRSLSGFVGECRQ